MDYYAHSTKTAAILECRASLNPTTLACQHGSVYRGNGAGLLRELAEIFEKNCGPIWTNKVIVGQCRSVAWASSIPTAMNDRHGKEAETT